MLQIAICDTNRDDLSAMEQLISKYSETKKVRCEYTAFSKSLDLVFAMKKRKLFDIYCLETVMPDLTGIEVAKIIRRFNPTAPIVFISSTNGFAAESYALKAANYLLKPASHEKLFPVLDELLEQTLPAKDEAALIVKTKGGLEKILISNLVFAKASNAGETRRLLYHLRCGTIVEGMQNLSWACDNLLQYGCFVKPHRSYVVNLQYADTIEVYKVTKKNKLYQIILQNLAAVHIAPGKAREIKQRLLEWQMNEQ